MSSAVDSPAKISRWLAKALGSAEVVLAYGRNTHASFVSFDPAMSLWKTFQRSLVEDLERYSETWPRSGMTRSGIAYQLPTLAPLTEETEYGLWPTPTINGNYNRKGASATSGDGLATAVRMWPTPRSADADKGIRTAAGHAKERERRGNGVDLPTAVHFSTPRTTPRTAREYDGVSPLVHGGLNPTWVEWLMGFPLEYTALEPSAMPLSRKSPKSSGAPL